VNKFEVTSKDISIEKESDYIHSSAGCKTQKAYFHNLRGFSFDKIKSVTAMPLDPNKVVNVCLATGSDRERSKGHWMLELRNPSSATCTCYHSTGGPYTNGVDYKVEIRSNILADKDPSGPREFLGTISGADIVKVNEIVHCIPAQHSQQWVAVFVHELERRRILSGSNARRLAANVCMDRVSEEYRRDHPVPEPVTASRNIRSHPLSLRRS
jgi:hypothetical protein